MKEKTRIHLSADDISGLENIAVGDRITITLDVVAGLPSRYPMVSEPGGKGKAVTHYEFEIQDGCAKKTGARPAHGPSSGTRLAHELD